MDKYLGKMLDNRYELLDIIGVGGMAVVYKARCHRLNRLVAVKVLKEDYAKDADFRRRFHAESQAVAMLSHPNIVAVYDVSRSSELEYIVMELIDGITLKQYMQKKGRLSWRESLHFATQITKALSHAHSRGIIHRDIKPHNIMILRDGSVKVADFGIARFAAVQNTLTQDALGSVHYISPEQARGSHIDARSDIYSVGVVLYEMLTSRLPYEGDSPVSVAIQHINSMPLTPREIDPEIPQALETITMKAMSASVLKRYSSAEAMLRDLEEFRKNPSISFDYDVAELMAKDPASEPTKTIVPGDVAAGTAKGKRRNRDMDDEEEAYRSRKRNSSLTLLVGILCILIFVVGMGYLVFSLLGIGSNLPGDDPETEVAELTVPRLIGQDYRDVQRNPEYSEFIIELSSEEVYDANNPEGTIIKQQPPQNTIIKATTPIKVTLSLGPRTVQLDDYYNREVQWVQVDLQNSGLVPDGEPLYEISESITKDYVIRTEPPAHSTVREGDRIKLVVSKGPRVNMVEMPSIINRPEAEALRILEQFNLVQGMPTAVESDEPKGNVVWQSVKKGEQVEEKTAIDYQISLGPVDVSPSPDPDETPSPGVEDPSPPPSGNGETPAGSGDEVITQTRVIGLPDTPGTVHVKVNLNGVSIYDQVVNTADGTVQITATGRRSDLLDVYFDGTFKFSEPLDPALRGM